jgi:catechol 2,3-dioxygenase-like lactoylglutathione lyase family enzyme
MRLDHIAYRTKNRYKTAEFFKRCFGYKIGTKFKLKFEDGSTTDCITLEPPETRHPETSNWTHRTLMGTHLAGPGDPIYGVHCEFHAPPEIFVSDGPKGSIVGDWVEERGGVGGIHHIAYQVGDVEAAMKEWEKEKYVEFLSEKPMECPGLKQVFTKPSELTGVIYELIKRDGNGFCEDNVKALMESTREL